MAGPFIFHARTIRLFIKIVIYLLFAIFPCNFHCIPPGFRHVSPLKSTWLLRMKNLQELHIGIISGAKRYHRT